MHLSQAILYVDDVAGLRDFYRDLFGLRVIHEEAGWIRLEAGACVLALHVIRRPDGAPPPGPATVRSGGAVKLCFRTDDVERERARLVAAGVAMRDVHRYDEVTFCDGVDPEGNVFQLTTY